MSRWYRNQLANLGKLTRKQRRRSDKSPRDPYTAKIPRAHINSLLPAFDPSHLPTSYPKAVEPEPISEREDLD